MRQANESHSVTGTAQLQHSLYSTVTARSQESQSQSHHSHSTAQSPSTNACSLFHGPRYTQDTTASLPHRWPVLRYEDGGMAVHKLHVLLDQSGYYSGEEDMVGRCRLTPG